MHSHRQRDLIDIQVFGLLLALSSASGGHHGFIEQWVHNKVTNFVFVVGFKMTFVFGFYCTWLWSGKGMMEAQTPRIMEGWISQCV